MQLFADLQYKGINQQEQNLNAYDQRGGKRSLPILPFDSEPNKFLPPASGVEVLKTVRCVCVYCELALSWLNRLTYSHRIWYRE